MPRSTGGAHGNLMHAAMNQYHQQISAHVEATVNDLHQRWAPVKATLHQSINRLTQQMAAAQKAGATVDNAWLSQSARLALLKGAVEGDVSKFASGARQIVSQGQTTAATLGSTAAQEALAATVPPGISYTFGVTPADVLAQQAGALQPGTPLSNLFAQMGPDAADRAQQALFTSVAIGDSAAATAQRLVWATDMSVQRAELIARTEMMRSWRGAQLANYQANSDVVRAWQWSADFGPRCCGACMAMDGSIHPLDEQLDSHPACRCSALPITLPWSDILSEAGISTANMPASLLAADARGGVLAGRETGAQWFARQAPGMQNAILGPAKAEAYRAGDLSLAQLVGVTRSPLWGDSIQERSLKALGMDAQRYLAAARSNGTAALATRADLLDATAVHAEALSAEARAAYKASADAWYASIEQSIAQAGGSAEQRAAYKAANDAWYAKVEQSIAAGNADAAQVRASAESWYANIERLMGDTGDSAEAVAARKAAADEWYARIEQSIAGNDKAYAPLSVPGGRGEVATYTLTAEDRAFAQALARQIPDGGITDYQEAIALGQQLGERINGQLTGLQAASDEAMGIRTRVGAGANSLIPLTMPELAPAEQAWMRGEAEALAAHGGVTFFDAPQQLQSAYQAQVRAYLAEIRPLGGVDVNLADGADALLSERLASATELMPSDWLAASNDLGELSLIKSTERSSGGWFQENWSGTGTVAIRSIKASDPAQLESAVLHEMTHRMEQAIPTLSDMQTQFYEARTVGNDYVALTNGIKQQTKLDEWLDQYLGREPVRVSHPGILQPDGKYRYATKSYELLTMGSEMALAPGASAATFALHADSEYEAFVLGSLMGVRAPEGEVAAAAKAAAESAREAAANTITGETAFAARQAVGTALSADERAAVQEAVARGELPKSYGKYTSVEQLTKTAKGSAWYTERAATSEAVAPASETTFTPELGTAEQIQVADEAHGFFGVDEHGYYEWEHVQETLGGQLADNPDVLALAAKLQVYDAAAEEMRPAETAVEAVRALLTEYHGGYARNATPLMIALQHAVEQEFGLSARAYTYDAAGLDEALAQYSDVLPGIQAVVREMYGNTQAWFADQDIADVWAYRGMKWREGKQPEGVIWDQGPQVVTARIQAMSSFSVSPWNAATFTADGRYVMVAGADIPVERILSIPQTGFGAYGEYELLVLGGEDDYLALPLHDTIGAAGGDYPYTREQLYQALGNEHIDDVPLDAGVPSTQTSESPTSLHAMTGEVVSTTNAATSADLATTASRALTDGERTAIQDAITAGDLPKSYAKYTRVEQLTKTAKGSDWYAAHGETAVEAAPQAGQATAFTDEPPFTTHAMVESFDSSDSTRLGGVNGARLTTINGQQFVVKRITDVDIFGNQAKGNEVLQQKAEVASTAIAQALGMKQYVTPTWAVEQEGRQFVASAYLSDATGVVAASKDALLAVSSEQYGDVTLLNYVLGERDANSANLLYDATNGRLVTIDHSGALASKYPAGAEISGASSMYWHMQALGETNFDIAGANLAGYDQMIFAPARIQAILDAQPQMEAILKEQGMKGAIGPLRQRLAILRKLSQRSAPSYDDLFELVRGYRVENQ